MVKTLVHKNIPYSHWEYLDCESGDRLRVVPERGGLITEWLCSGKEILYFDLDRFKLKDKSIRGGIPILFPICGGLPQGLIKLSKGDFPIHQHGFARDICWKIKDIYDNKGFSLFCVDTEQTRKSYPFNFFLEMKVKLDKGALSIIIIVQNRSDEIMPFSFGLHPYFNILDLRNVEIKGLSDSCFNHINMATTSTKEQLDCLDKGVDFLANSEGSVSIFDLTSNTSIEIEHPEPMNLAVVWTDPPRNMVCLEPWSSPRNSLISGDRLLTLDSGRHIELNCRFLTN
tara:strand:+ start:6306 stop:7160 length:855 start_codon:yes stop_codon:yes gene_type:complete